MNHLRIIAVSVFTMAATLAQATDASGAKKTDLTPVFAGMEKDCGRSNSQFGNIMGWLSTDNGKAPSISKAAPQIQAAIGSARIKVKDNGDSWILFAPLTNATYRGVPVIGIDRWIGKDNGYNGIALRFADTIPLVVKSIGKMKVAKNSEETMPEMGIQEGSKRATLVCDFST